MNVGKKKFGLFEAILFCLIVLEELPKSYVFSSSETFHMIANVAQLPLYLGLIYLIVENKYPMRQFSVFVVIAALLLIGYARSGQAAYFRAFLLMIAAGRTPFRRVVKVCRIAMTGTFAATVLMWILGISDSGVGRRGKLAFGYVHPNYVAQVVMILILLWLVEKGNRERFLRYILLEVTAIAVLFLTGSKTAGIVIAAAPLVVELCRYGVYQKAPSKLTKLLLEGSQLLILLFTWLSAKLLPYSGVLKKLDLIFTNRLFLNYYQFTKYPLKLFGQNVSLHEPGGAYNEIQHFWAAITCDCTYTLSLVVMGLIPTALFALGYVLLMRKALRSRDYLLVSAALLLALYAFCESQLVEIYNNFVYLSLFALARTDLQERRKLCDT